MSSSITSWIILNSSDMVLWEHHFSRRTYLIQMRVNSLILVWLGHEHLRWPTKWRIQPCHTATALLLSGAAAYWTQVGNHSVRDSSSSMFLTGQRQFLKVKTHHTEVQNLASWVVTIVTYTPAWSSDPKIKMSECSCNASTLVKTSIRIPYTGSQHTKIMNTHWKICHLSKGAGIKISYRNT